MKSKGPHKPSKGREYTYDEVVKKKIEALLILDFIYEYKVDLSVEAIGYHMKNNKIDYIQPSRDRFVLLTKVTLDFYGLKKKSNAK